MGIKMRKHLNLYHTQMLPRAKKKNKIIMKLNGERKRKRKHKNNSLCAINST